MDDSRSIESVRQEVDFSSLEGGPWDGRRYSYIPREPLHISADLDFFTDEAPVDPVTYQVLRWKFWGANLEHSDTIRRCSGSPVIVYMDDFATSILTARGDILVCGPTVQYFTGMSDLCVKWTLENRSNNPGIADGDIFLQNDPYIGTAHQIDTALYGPVFWEGKLICWVFSACHVGDIGGNSPGSFCVTAKSIYDEPLPIPPIKVGRNDELSADVAELFTRQSRNPEMIGLQLRSQVAGFIATKKRILSIIAQYGPEVVTGAMARMIDDCDAAVGRRLKQIPDGTWSERICIGGVTIDDRQIHQIVSTIRKEGDQLVCSNRGTSPQIDSGNCTYAAWRSGLLCAAAAMLAYDQTQCVAGLLRHMRFEPQPGTLNCAVHPGACTTLTGNLQGLAAASQVMSRMLMNGPPEIAENALTVGGGGAGGWWIFVWPGPEGQMLAEFSGDAAAAALGASPARDGHNQGGSWVSPNSVAGDVEEWEEAMPLLYLYRKDALDSGGPGYFRGGNGLSSAIISHKTSNALMQMMGIDYAVNNCPGLGGGLPGVSGNFLWSGGTDVQARLSAATVPNDEISLTAAFGAPVRVHPRGTAAMGPNDVLTAVFAGSGGFGDPLQRLPVKVAEDVRDMYVSRGLALRAYGVVVDESGNVDVEATVEARARIRRQRLAAATPPIHNLNSALEKGPIVHRAGGSLAVIRSGPRLAWCCAECGAPLGALADNYKHGCAVIATDPQRVDDARYPDPLEFGDIPMELRQYICPSCATVLSVEFCRADDPPFYDLQLDEQSIRARIAELGELNKGKSE